MPDITKKHIADLTLLLAYLTAWQEEPLPGESEPGYRAWKGYDFDILNQLQEQGLISQSNKAKSLYLTARGLEKAKQLAEKLLRSYST